MFQVYLDTLSFAFQALNGSFIVNEVSGGSAVTSGCGWVVTVYVPYSYKHISVNQNRVP